MCFVASGCSGLLAEQIFEKLLSTLLGASTPAAAAVLAIYFAGLTLGGGLYGPVSRRLQFSPTTLYAAAEAVIAAWALGLLVFFDHLVPAIAPVLAGAFPNQAALLLARLAVAAAWILPPTLAMGATFPAVVDIVSSLADVRAPRLITRFYSLNLLGAVGGAVAGPYLVFPSLGVAGGLGVVVVTNLAICLAVAGFAGRSAPRPDGGRESEGGASSEPLPLMLLVVGAVSGFVFFALEVAWTHLIAAVIGNSVYAFATMLAVVLAALAVGGLLASLIGRARHSVSTTMPAVLLALGGVLLAAGHSRWPFVPHLLALSGARIESFGAAELLRWREALILLFPPAVAFGMVYPSLFRLVSFPRTRRGRFAGLLVACNSAGCCAGALLTAFVVLPALGSERTLQLLALVSLVVAALLGLQARDGSRRIPLLLGGVGVALVLLQPRWDPLALTSGEQVYFHKLHVGPTSRLVFLHEDTTGGITTVIEDPPPSSLRTLLTNGKFQGNDGGEVEAQRAFALVPLLFVDRFDRALVIGLGTGCTAGIVHRARFRTVDVAEIAPGIVAAAGELFGPLNGSVLSRPNVHVFLEDGRNLLLLRPDRYDLITIEISSVWFAGSTNLYSREFYRQAARRLESGGVLQQWIQIHHISQRELEVAIATARSVFPHVSFWVVGGQGIIVCSERAQTVTDAALAALGEYGPSIGLSPAALPEYLRHLAQSRLLAPEDVTGMVERQRPPLNTDRNRRLEYTTPRFNQSDVPFEKVNREGLRAFAAGAGVPVAPSATSSLARALRDGAPQPSR